PMPWLLASRSKAPGFVSASRRFGSRRPSRGRPLPSSDGDPERVVRGADALAEEGVHVVERSSARWIAAADGVRPAPGALAVPEQVAPHRATPLVDAPRPRPPKPEVDVRRTAGRRGDARVGRN